MPLGSFVEDGAGPAVGLRLSTQATPSGPIRALGPGCQPHKGRMAGAQPCRGVPSARRPDPEVVGHGAVRVGAPAQDAGRSGHRSYLQFLGQLADLRRRIAAMPTKGLQERQLAVLGPAGHRLGRHVQDVGHLSRMEVAGKIRCGLTAGLGCHGASPFRAADPEAVPGPKWTGCSSSHEGGRGNRHGAGGHAAACRTNGTIMQTGQTAGHSPIVELTRSGGHPR
jgi:hypothetical protein